MNFRRKEFVSEIKRLKLELAEVDRRLSELGELANPTCSPVTSENTFAAKVAFGMAKSRINSHH